MSSADVWRCWDSALGHEGCHAENPSRRARNSITPTTKTVQLVAQHDQLPLTGWPPGCVYGYIWRMQCHFIWLMWLFNYPTNLLAVELVAGSGTRRTADVLGWGLRAVCGTSAPAIGLSHVTAATATTTQLLTDWTVYSLEICTALCMLMQICAEICKICRNMYYNIMF